MTGDSGHGQKSVTFDQNHWSRSVGTTGHVQSESAVKMARNTQLSLTAVNGNAYALAAIPIVLLAGRLPFRLPRMTWVFYAFYPAHLLLLLGVRLEWFQP